MNERLKAMIDAANRGERVLIDEIDRAFEMEKHKIECTVELPAGGAKRYTFAVPDADNAEALEIVRDYFYSWIYNIISTLGGKVMRFNICPGDDIAARLCANAADVFDLSKPRKERSGYGKCLNVTDRVNMALGFDPFRFETVIGEPGDLAEVETESKDAVSNLLNAIKTVEHGAWCGLDIGGTDIKAVGVKDGHLTAVKEYDWDPASFKTVDDLLAPVLLLTRVICTAVTASAYPEAAARIKQMLDREATDETMRSIAETLEEAYGRIELDGVGISFPDVTIRDIIVGGETSKTQGIRKASEDYDSEFARMTNLNAGIAAFCREGAKVRIANDGSLAAYTAAVEWAASEANRATVHEGVFAHSLGTDLGTGWIDERGEIPQIPLEVYNCVIDLGNKPARRFLPEDVRSASNFNTGIAGIPQKYTGQYGAYRLALEKFAKEAPEEYEKLFDLGYLEKSEAGIFVVKEPKDMRKPLLEHLMNLASEGQPQAEEVFREIGEYLAVIWYVTEKLLGPKVKSRVLFGRFVKKQRCFELIREGASRRTEAPFMAADSSMAFTPVMMELDRDPDHTVAQFGQAVGAVYFSV